MDGIDCFPSHHDKRYIQVLREHLTIDHLMESAVPPPKGQKVWEVGTGGERLSFIKRCSISFLGISGATFFDRNKALMQKENDPTLLEELERIFERHDDFARQNIWLRIRFLFIYPYSTFAMSVINAETTTRRSSIAGTKPPTSQVELHVDEDRFKGSTLFRNQRIALKSIQQWLNLYWPLDHSQPGNSLAVRFTPLSPSICGLILNKTAFYSSYLFAKSNRFSESLEFSPVVQVNACPEGEVGPFRRVEDHFRYLWQSNITLDCRDATEFKRMNNFQGEDEYYGLTRVRPPDRISFTAKARALAARPNRKGLSRIVDDKKEQWGYAAYEQFLRYATLPQESIPSRVVFISCSWGDDGFLRRPHAVALYLKELIDEDFGSSVTAELMRGNPGEALPGKLFSLLNSSSLAIFLLTCDVPFRENQKYTRPNVYHELGYLMARMQPVYTPHLQENSRLLIVREHGVSLASNIGHLIVEDLQDGHVVEAMLGTDAKGKAGTQWQSAGEVLSEAPIASSDLKKQIAKVQALRLYSQTLAWFKQHMVPMIELSNAKSKLIKRISEFGNRDIRRLLDACCEAELAGIPDDTLVQNRDLNKRLW